MVAVVGVVEGGESGSCGGCGRGRGGRVVGMMDVCIVEIKGCQLWSL